jgi:hypothetical protein
LISSENLSSENLSSENLSFCRFSEEIFSEEIQNETLLEEIKIFQKNQILDSSSYGSKIRPGLDRFAGSLEKSAEEEDIEKTDTGNEEESTDTVRKNHFDAWVCNYFYLSPPGICSREA